MAFSPPLDYSVDFRNAIAVQGLVFDSGNAAYEAIPVRLMTTTEIVKLVAQRLRISQRAARAIVHAKLDMLVRQLHEEGLIALEGLGKFSVKTTATRSAYIPGKARPYLIPPRKRAAFSVYRSLRKKLKQSVSEE